MIPIVGLFDFNEKRENAGRAVIFCPVCRELRAAEARRFRREIVSLFVIPLWRWDARTELSCPACKAEYHHPDDYPCLPDAPDDADPLDLLAQIDGELFDQITTRAELERAREEDRLSHTQREQLIAEPFRQLDHLAPQVSSSSIPTLTGLSLIGLVFGIPVAVAVWIYIASTLARVISALVILILIALIVLDLRYLEPWRRGRSPYALLARALAPLDPSDEELRQALTTLSSEKVSIARRLRIHRLRRALDALATQNPELPHAIAPSAR